MDTYILKLLVIGTLLLTVTLGSGWIARVPFSYAIIYLIVGILLGPQGTNLIEIRPDAQFLERLTEMVVIISVFGCGLKINRPLSLASWRATARLIGFLMPISIVAVAVVGHWLIGLEWGAAILLGAILAPTDPVLASEVQLSDIHDKDELRFGLTSEGGINDALAFPFVYFGIYAMKDSNWNNWIGDWVWIDLLWAIAAGIVMGIVVAKVIVIIDRRLQKIRPADDVMQDFVALATILLTYSVTELVNGYGFLAVFVAGVVVQRNYISQQDKRLAQLEYTEQIEKLAEVATILLIGSVLLWEPMVKTAVPGLILAAILFVIIRPVGVWISTIGMKMPRHRRLLFGWFGVRGVGSIYYLTYAMGSGIGGDQVEVIAWITFTIVLLSILIHGISATPLMNNYEKSLRKKHRPQQTSFPVESGK